MDTTNMMDKAELEELVLKHYAPQWSQKERQHIFKHPTLRHPIDMRQFIRWVVETHGNRFPWSTHYTTMSVRLCQILIDSGFRIVMEHSKEQPTHSPESEPVEIEEIHDGEPSYRLVVEGYGIPDIELDSLTDDTKVILPEITHLSLEYNA